MSSSRAREVRQELSRRLRRARVALTDRVDLMRSRSVGIDGCRTVCLALGPYRNLTTLTAATLFLHPNCQVLNHAGTRIFGNPRVDFLSDFSKERLDRFIRFAIKISAKGQRGGLGGSITFSHAFDDRRAKRRMRTAHDEVGTALTKEHIESLFWKESLRTSNLIRDEAIDLSAIFEQDDRLRFLLPVRNPMDCAISNTKTGHVHLFHGLDHDSSVGEALEAILDEIHWFASYRAKFPDRFFWYFENAISREMLVDLARFLKIEPDEHWLENALGVMVIKPSYDHDADLMASYRGLIERKFADDPELSERLLSFV